MKAKAAAIRQGTVTSPRSAIRELVIEFLDFNGMNHADDGCDIWVPKQFCLEQAHKNDAALKDKQTLREIEPHINLSRPFYLSSAALVLKENAADVTPHKVSDGMLVLVPTEDADATAPTDVEKLAKRINFLLGP